MIADSRYGFSGQRTGERAAVCGPFTETVDIKSTVRPMGQKARLSVSIRGLCIPTLPGLLSRHSLAFLLSQLSSEQPSCKPRGSAVSQVFCPCSDVQSEACGCLHATERTLQPPISQCLRARMFALDVGPGPPIPFLSDRQTGGWFPSQVVSFPRFSTGKNGSVDSEDQES